MNAENGIAWSAPVSITICRACDKKIEQLRALTKGVPGARFNFVSLLCAACSERFEEARRAATEGA